MNSKLTERAAQNQIELQNKLGRYSVHYDLNLAVQSFFDFSPDLIWTDVALLDSDGQLDWAGIINDRSRHAVSFCPQACHSDKPAPPPPCILEIVGESNACSFRRKLSELERLTKSPDSRSLGELSKLCFSKLNGFSPYISTFSTEFVPLLYTREAILKKLASEANVLLPDTKQSKDYAKAAQDCMPAIKTKSNSRPLPSGAVLIPLTQSIDRHVEHVGAIVICGLQSTGMWRHLQRVKALATALLESRREQHKLFGLASDPGINLGRHLMRVLELFPFNRSLFYDECDEHCRQPVKPEDCKLVANKDVYGVLRHDYGDCRLVRVAAFSQIYSRLVPNLLLQKELFCWRAKNAAPATKHSNTKHFPIVELQKYFAKWGFTLEFPSEMTCISLPTTPGALSLICLSDLAGYLKARKMTVKTVGTANTRLRWTFECDEALTTLKEQWRSRNSDAVQYLLRSEGGTIGALFRAAYFLPSRFIFNEHPSIAAHWPVSNQPIRVTFEGSSLELEWKQQNCTRGCNAINRFGWDNSPADSI